MLKQKFKTSGHPKVKPAFSKQQGFSLMEVLIAMIIIAIGLLGFLSLQLASINSNQEGLARTQATLIGQDLAASMRGNRKFINDTDGTLNPYLNNDAYNTCTSEPPQACGTAGSNCTATQQAEYDVWKVCATLSGFDGSTAGTVANDPMIGGQVRVSCKDRDTLDGDICSPGSTFSIFTYWQTGALREDVGQTQAIIRNARCDALAPGDDFDCTVIDLMP
ncbi:type IV pilus modification protein PilV [Kangiella sp.]|uniref:type IV pilus modification protein PilV n=1 Tax=Kangiella sp. TaxID=1920245 RepID=UPI0019C7DE0A|nr:type IV pilus modification protein PilV [Kangiella sp.]MBD3653685.1 type IV pilus modification protein PilV [Kangiella sp.]